MLLGVMGWIVKVLVAQSCPTLCDLMDCSPPSSSIHGIFQTRILEWVVIFLRIYIHTQTYTHCCGRYFVLFMSDWATNTNLLNKNLHALEKEMATHSSILAWRIPGTREPGGLLSIGSHRVGHDWSDLAAAAACSTGNSTQYALINYMRKESKK